MLIQSTDRLDLLSWQLLSAGFAVGAIDCFLAVVILPVESGLPAAVGFFVFALLSFLSWPEHVLVR